MHKCSYIPQNLIICTGQVWRQVFIAVVTVVAATQRSHLGNVECYTTFSCLLTKPTLGNTTAHHKEKNRNLQTHFLYPVLPYYFLPIVERLQGICQFNKEQV